MVVRRKKRSSKRSGRRRGQRRPRRRIVFLQYPASTLESAITGDSTTAGVVAPGVGTSGPVTSNLTRDICAETPPLKRVRDDDINNPGTDLII